MFQRLTNAPRKDRVPQRDRGLKGIQNHVLVSSLLALPPSRARGIDAAKTTLQRPPIGARSVYANKSHSARLYGCQGEPSTWKARRTALETYDAVATKIREYLSRNFLFSDQGFQYEDDASFLELGIIDSFAFVELLHWVQEEFSISVADDELVPDNFDSVRKLSSFILGKQSGGT